MSETVLVTAIGGNVATGIIRCLADYDCKLIGCDITEYPMGIDLVERFYQVPFAVNAAYIPTILSICKESNVSIIIPVNEVEIRIIEEERKIFEERGIKILLAPHRLLETAFDKYKCAKKLLEIGCWAPNTYLAEEFIPDGKTYIAKLRTASGSKFIKKVSTQFDVDNVIRQYPNEVIIQEYLPDEKEEYTVGVFSDGDVTRSIAFRRKLLNGYTSKIELVYDESIKKMAEIVAKEFHLVGSINIQLRKMNGQNYIFEINPRLSGTVHFRHLLGFQDAVWWCLIKTGKKLPDYSEKYDKAVGIREVNEKIVYKKMK